MDQPPKNISAIRVLTSAIGTICGISGLEHGFFEILQGNTVPATNNINAIGESFRFWKYGFEYAYTIIPNFLLTGIVAMILSIAVIIFSAFFMNRKYGWLIFILLSTAQYLTGGGAAQIGMAIVIGIVASRINRPLKVWRLVFPENVRKILSKPWLILVISLSVVFCHSMVTAIFGFLYGISNPDTISAALFFMLYFMMGNLLLAIISAISHDSTNGLSEVSINKEDRI